MSATDRLLAKLDQMNSAAYRTKNDWMADISNPLYTAQGPEGDSWRELVDARLAASPHIWQSNPAVRENPGEGMARPGEAMTAYVSTVDGKVTTRIAEPGHIVGSAPLPENREPEFVDNGSSVTIKVSGEDPRGSEGGQK